MLPFMGLVLDIRDKGGASVIDFREPLLSQFIHLRNHDHFEPFPDDEVFSAVTVIEEEFISFRGLDHEAVAFVPAAVARLHFEKEDLFDDGGFFVHEVIP